MANIILACETCGYKVGRGSRTNGRKRKPRKVDKLRDRQSPENGSGKVVKDRKGVKQYCKICRTSKMFYPLVEESALQTQEARKEVR